MGEKKEKKKQKEAEEEASSWFEATGGKTKKKDRVVMKENTGRRHSIQVDHGTPSAENEKARKRKALRGLPEEESGRTARLLGGLVTKKVSLMPGKAERKARVREEASPSGERARKSS